MLGGQGWRLPNPSLRGRELGDRRNDRINQFLHEKENSCASSFMYYVPSRYVRTELRKRLIPYVECTLRTKRTRT